MVEELLKFLIGKINTQLFETVKLILSWRKVHEIILKYCCFFFTIEIEVLIKKIAQNIFKHIPSTPVIINVLLLMNSCGKYLRRKFRNQQYPGHQ
jgi:hypothetical protein